MPSSNSHMLYLGSIHVTVNPYKQSKRFLHVPRLLHQHVVVWLPNEVADDILPSSAANWLSVWNVPLLNCMYCIVCTDYIILEIKYVVNLNVCGSNTERDISWKITLVIFSTYLVQIIHFQGHKLCSAFNSVCFFFHRQGLRKRQPCHCFNLMPLQVAFSKLLTIPACDLHPGTEPLHELDLNYTN